MKSHKYVTVLIVTVLMIAAIGSAVMLSTSSNTSTDTVSVIISNSSSDTWTSFKAGLNQAATDYGMKLNIVLTDHFESDEQENELIQREIKNGTDAVVIEPYSSVGMENEIDSLARTMPVILVGSGAVHDSAYEENTATVLVDDEAVGKAVAAEMHIYFGDFAANMKIGVVAGNQEQSSMQSRLTGLKESLEKNHGTIAWEISGTEDLSSKIEEAYSSEKADVIVALDNEGLEAAADYVSDNSIDIPVFGVGNSEKCAYYVGNSVINSMIVPDYYNMGYQSIANISAKLNHSASDLGDFQCSYSIVNADNMFTQRNQELLFPIVQ